MPTAWTGYTPGGSSQTVTNMDAPAFPGMPGMGGFDPTALLSYKLRQEERDKAFEREMRMKALRMQQPQLPHGQASQVRGGGGEPTGMQPLPTGTIRNPAAVTPRSLGRFQMNHTGNWGTFVDPADIPAGLQDQIMGGMYGQAGNWDSSNPSIVGPQQWRTGKYTHGGGGALQASIGPGGETGEGGGPTSNRGFDYLSPVEQARWQRAALGMG